MKELRFNIVVVLLPPIPSGQAVCFSRRDGYAKLTVYVLLNWAFPMGIPVESHIPIYID